MSAHARWASVLADAEPGSPAPGAALASAHGLRASCGFYASSSDILLELLPGAPAHGAALASALVMQASTATYHGGALASDHAGGVGNLNHCCGWHRSGRTRAEQLPCGQGAATASRQRDSLTLQNGQDW